MTLRWGIVSTGLISHDFAAALSTLPADEHTIIAVAARKKKDAERFFHNIPKSYEVYDQLLTDPDVDVVYIGTINNKHYEIAVAAFRNGKHVLCEKPLCMNYKQAKALLDYAKSQRLFCMEAVWTRFFPAFTYLKKRIDDGELGDIQHVEAALGHGGWGEVDRVKYKQLGGGTILDLGVYSIQAALWVIPSGSVPTSIEATGVLNSDWVDSEMKATIKFDGDVEAKVSCSGIHSFHNRLIVRGTKGEITIPSFWAPTSLIDLDGQRKEWKLPKANHRFNFPNSCGLRYEAEEVRQCIENGLLESVSMTHEDSLRIAQIQDECRRQIGVIYDEDNQDFICGH